VLNEEEIRVVYRVGEVGGDWVCLPVGYAHDRTLVYTLRDSTYRWGKEGENHRAKETNNI
jgi:hypothetical protein